MTRKSAKGSTCCLAVEALEDRTTPVTAFALGVGADANILVEFDTAAPGTIVDSTPIGGLGAFTLVGIDFRPATGQLYGVGVNGNSVQVFTINANSGAATAVGTAATVNTVAGATSWGVDFNPQNDRIRVINDLASDGAGGNANNFRLNPDDGTLVAVDADLDYSGLPGGAGAGPEVAVAYSNSFTGTTTTTLRGIVSGGNRLVANLGAAPDFATLQDIGALGVDVSNNAAFDISGATNIAFAILEVGGVSGLYSIDLTSGAATPVGPLGSGTSDFGGLAIAPSVPTVSLSVDNAVIPESGGVATITATLSNPYFRDVSIPLVISSTATPGADFNPAPGAIISAGATTATFTITAIADSSDEKNEIVNVALGSLVNGVAGTPNTVTVIIADDDLGVASAGGPTNGTAQLLIPSAGTYSPGPVLTPFPGAGANVRGAVGDVNNDGFDDTVLVSGPGIPIQFVVISGTDNTTVLVPPTSPFAGSEDFTGGGFISVSDIEGDGFAEIIITPDLGGGPRVSIFTLSSTGIVLRANFFGIDDPNFRGGVRTAAGDVNNDRFNDLAVAAGFLGGPRVALFDGRTILDGATPARLINDFFAFPGDDATRLRNGAYVAIGDINGDLFADLIFGGGPGGAPRVFILSGTIISAGDIGGAQANPIANFFVAGNSADRGGVRVASKDADGDLRSDLLTGSGTNSPARVRVYLGANFTGAGEPVVVQDLPLFGNAVLADGVYVG